MVKHPEIVGWPTLATSDKWVTYIKSQRDAAAAAADRESMNWDSLTCLSLCGLCGATTDTSGLVNSLYP